MKLKRHLDIVFGSRKALAKHKSKSVGDEGYVLVMADAADQAKQGSPVIREGGRAGSQVKKIKQQFIGVIVHGVGYIIYRRLPVTPKGANLTATILLDLFAKGYLRKAHTLVLQWDGASENVAKTNWRLAIWLLMREKGLRNIVFSRLDVGHSHFAVDQRHGVFARCVRGQRKRGCVRQDVHSLGAFEDIAWRAHSDLKEFVEIGKLFNFDDWLQPMRCRLEDGIQVRNSFISRSYRAYTHNQQHTRVGPSGTPF